MDGNINNVHIVQCIVDTMMVFLLNVPTKRPMSECFSCEQNSLSETVQYNRLHYGKKLKKIYIRIGSLFAIAYIRVLSESFVGWIPKSPSMALLMSDYHFSHLKATSPGDDVFNTFANSV